MTKKIRSTTILAVKRNECVAIASDGQVSFGNTVMKSTTNKLRVMQGGKVITGFAGSTADAFTLFEKFESKLDEYKDNITRAVVEMAKQWRTDKILRRLEALLLVAHKDKLFILSGSGDVIEPDDPICAIGSGGNYALAAARGLFAKTTLSAREIVEVSMGIAADICVFTNHHITIEEIK